MNNNYNIYENRYQTEYADYSGLKNHMTKIFILMSIALFISAITSFIGYGVLSSSPQILENFTYILIASAVIQLILVIALGPIVRKTKNITLSIALFLLYSVITGITFSSIGLIYSGEAITHAFVVTMLYFIALCIVGHLTEYKILKYGKILVFALIFLIVAEVISAIFFNSHSSNLIFDVLAIAIFSFYTVYDFQAIKARYLVAKTTKEKNISLLMGALNLYLDFINLFIRLLSLLNRE